jgi:predicted amidophosphoribosyltransferase
MSNYCPDCGCHTSRGICSNCQEELYIIENQIEYITEPLSQEFMDKAKEQKEYLEKRKGT